MGFTNYQLNQLKGVTILGNAFNSSIQGHVAKMILIGKCYESTAICRAYCCKKCLNYIEFVFKMAPAPLIIIISKLGTCALLSRAQKSDNN